MCTEKSKINLRDYLGEEEVKHLSSRIYEKGDLLFREGDRPEGIFFVESGLFALTRTSENGVDTLLRLFTDQGFCGIRSYVDEDLYQASAQALSKSRILYINESLSQHLMMNNRSFLRLITQDLARDLKNAEERISDLISKPAAHRVVEGILYLKSVKADFSWSRKDISYFCGVKTETVSRTLTELESLELICRDKRRIRVLDEEKLASYMAEHE